MGLSVHNIKGTPKMFNIFNMEKKEYSKLKANFLKKIRIAATHCKCSQLPVMSWTDRQTVLV